MCVCVCQACSTLFRVHIFLVPFVSIGWCCLAANCSACSPDKPGGHTRWQITWDCSALLWSPHSSCENAKAPLCLKCWKSIIASPTGEDALKLCRFHFVESDKAHWTELLTGAAEQVWRRTQLVQTLRMYGNAAASDLWKITPAHLSAEASKKRDAWHGSSQLAKSRRSPGLSKHARNPTQELLKYPGYLYVCVHTHFLYIYVYTDSQTKALSSSQYCCTVFKFCVVVVLLLFLFSLTHIVHQSCHCLHQLPSYTDPVLRLMIGFTLVLLWICVFRYIKQGR